MHNQILILQVKKNWKEGERGHGQWWTFKADGPLLETLRSNEVGADFKRSFTQISLCVGLLNTQRKDIAETPGSHCADSDTWQCNVGLEAVSKVDIFENIPPDDLCMRDLSYVSVVS